MGGLLNIALAAKYPERVNRIINICSTPKFLEDIYWPGMPEIGLCSLVLPTVRDKGLSTFLQAFFEDEFAEFSSKPSNYKEACDIIATSANANINALAERMKLVDITDLRHAYQAIKCPIDFIMGDKDAAVPTAVYEEIKALNPHTIIHVIKDAKHAPFWTHPKEFNNVLQAILAD